jgi:HEAT repeat protein
MTPRLFTRKISVLAVAAFVLAAFVAGTCLDAYAADERDAKSAYRSARKALNADEYREAAEQFKAVYEKYPDSRYAAASMYWQAFALYRMDKKSSYREARRVLEQHLDKYSGTDTREDAIELYYSVLGKLAKMGDEEAAERLAEETEKQWEVDVEVDIDEHDIEEKIAAIHALINMRSGKALPILEKLLTDHDPAKAELREKALFLLSQYDSDEAADILIRVAREDPDPDVKKNAVFWLSQTHTEKAGEFLEELLTESDDPEMQEKAIFALSQIGDDRAMAALQGIAMDKSQSDHIRANAIFWLGQSGGRRQVEFLKDLYGELDNHELKEKVIFSVSQNDSRKGGEWLLTIVNDESEPTEVRKQALFWAGQTHALDVEGIAKVYKTARDRELREQAIFALSQRQDKEAVELMIDLARKEKDPELRKKLVFWIGQSGHPAAEEFLLEIIND